MWNQTSSASTIAIADLQKQICQRLEFVKKIMPKSKCSLVKHAQQQKGHDYWQENMLEKNIQAKE